MSKLLKYAVLLFLFFKATVLLSAQETNLTIRVLGIRNSEGRVNIALFNNPPGFPDDAEQAYRIKVGKINANNVEFVFEGIPPGEYAFSILHDENSDGKMNKNFLGIPLEGFAFSGEFKLLSGLPDYKEASFIAKPGDNILELEIIYFP